MLVTREMKALNLVGEADENYASSSPYGHTGSWQHQARFMGGFTCHG